MPQSKSGAPLTAECGYARAGKAYHIHLEGFFNEVGSTAELQAWVRDLKTRYPDLVGKTATVLKGERRGNAVLYASAPVQIVVSA